MVTEIKLGLCNPPEPIYLYVTVVEKIISEAHIDIPDGLNQFAALDTEAINYLLGRKA